MSKLGTTEKISGFSEQTHLGDIGKILKNPKIVLRAVISPPMPPSELRWRGIAFDQYLNNGWERSPLLSRYYRPLIYNNIDLSDNPADSGETEIIQEISLEAMDSDVIFTLYPIKSVSNLSERIRGIYTDKAASLFTPWPHYYYLSYKAKSINNDYFKKELSKQESSAYLDTEGLDRKILELALRLTSGIDDDYNKAKRIEEFLGKEMKYTRSIQAIYDSADPLYDFIFIRKEGHCEYFATALAMMLRSAGVPSRFINGFYGGEWNAYGEYYIVRQENAHSWVEAYIYGKGWTVFDATPSDTDPIRPNSFLTSLTMFLDSIKMSWGKYVVDYNLNMQIEAASGISHKISRVNKEVRQFIGKMSIKTESSMQNLHQIKAFFKTTSATLFILCFCTLIIALISIVIFFLKKQATAVSGIVFYNRLLSVFENRGFKKKASMTGYEFLDSLDGLDSVTKGKTKIIINTFYKVRYGEEKLNTLEINVINRLLKEIKKSMK